MDMKLYLGLLKLCINWFFLCICFFLWWKRLWWNTIYIRCF